MFPSNLKQNFLNFYFTNILYAITNFYEFVWQLFLFIHISFSSHKQKARAVMKKYPSPHESMALGCSFCVSPFNILYSYEYIVISEKTSCSVTKAIQTFLYFPRMNRVLSLFYLDERLYEFRKWIYKFVLIIAY